MGDSGWRGDDGTVSVGATSSRDLDFVTENSANHQLRPYGDDPTIADFSLAGYLYYDEDTGIDRPREFLAQEPCGAFQAFVNV